MADTQNIIAPIGTSNTPSIMSSSTALEVNKARACWSIQNLGQNPLYVRLGDQASTSVFHFALKSTTANDDGLGGLISQAEGVVYVGKITVAGTSPRYAVYEGTA